LDPEIATNGSNNRGNLNQDGTRQYYQSSFGVDYGNYPPAKTFNIGVSLGF